MSNKKMMLSLSVVSSLAVIILISKMGLGATAHNDNLKLKKQQVLERQLKGKTADKNRAALDNKQTQIPVPEPDEYKTPHQWAEGGAQLHGPIRSANTVWTVKGVMEPNQQVWDEFVAWSGANEDGKESITTFAKNGQIFAGKYDVEYICPNQNMGKIYIVDVKNDVLSLKTDAGVKGTFDLNSHKWNFNE